MAIRQVHTIIAKNTGKTPIRISIKPTKRSDPLYDADGGQLILNPGKSITVEEERVDLSHLENLRKLGSMKVFKRITEVGEAEEEAESLDLVFEYKIADDEDLTEISPDETVDGLFPEQDTTGTFRITNNGDLDANVSAASFDPGNRASVENFSSSTISGGSSNEFDIGWGFADPFEEDLTVTINGTDYTFTFEGEIVPGGF